MMHYETMYTNHVITKIAIIILFVECLILLVVKMMQLLRQSNQVGLQGGQRLFLLKKGWLKFTEAENVASDNSCISALTLLP
jgi:hypothetical protein